MAVSKHQTRFQPGDVVHWKLIAKPAIIAEVDPTPPIPLYSLDFGNGPLFWVTEDELTRGPVNQAPSSA